MHYVPTSEIGWTGKRERSLVWRLTRGRNLARDMAMPGKRGSTSSK
jgi:hypothetical protein